MLGVRDALASDPRVFVYGEDVGGKYGNAFLLLRPLLAEFGNRIVNSPLSESAVIGVCFGAALAGQRPIGDRPLLTLGVLLLITGLQFISTGLVGEMLRANSYQPGDEYAIRQVLEAPQSQWGRHGR